MCGLESSRFLLYNVKCLKDYGYFVVGFMIVMLFVYGGFVLYFLFFVMF